MVSKYAKLDKLLDNIIGCPTCRNFMRSSISRVEQVVDQILRNIHAGLYEGGRLPSEPKLARMLGTSRTTVRQALAALEMDGILVRKHGSGTFINQNVLNIGSRLEEVWDFSEMIQLSGAKPGVQHIKLSLEKPTLKVADKLSLSPQDEVLSTINVFLADGQPVIYCKDIIPAGLVRSAYHDEELYGPVYTFLQRRCQQRVEYNITQVFPVAAENWLSRALNCRPGSPLHYFEEVAFNSDEVPIMYSEEYYRPEFFSFIVVRKMTTGRRSETT